MSEVKERLYYLDTLRAVAALMVVFSHFAERTPLHDLTIFRYFTPGQFGVVVFFMLSGFVIPYSLKEGPAAVLRFSISRFFRLYPAYWVSVGLAAFAIVYFKEEPFDLKLLLANLTMLQLGLGFHDMFGVYWTLLIELIFYGGCAFLALLGLLKNMKVRFYLAMVFLAVALAGAALIYFEEINIRVGIFCALSLMFFGSVWRDALLERVTGARIYSVIWAVSFVLIFPVIALWAYNVDRGQGQSVYNYTGSYWAGIVFFLLMSSVFRVQGRILAYLGAISYSLYLTHPFFLELCASTTEMANGFNIVVFLGYMAATILLSMAVHSWVEQPGILYGRRLSAFLERRLASGRVLDRA